MAKGNFNQLIQSEQPILIDFYADWCGPCKTMAPILQEVAQATEGKARIIKIDIDKNPALANQYQVKSVPTFMLFKSGKNVWRQAGALSKEALLSVIHQQASS
ncbi:MAG: thioredoxin [Thermonemataceae bacterium]